MKISFDRDFILNLNQSLTKEYLLTNGNGAYASSSILDCHTRKYHGLLAVPLENLNATYLLLSKLDCALVLDKKEHRLSTNKFPGVFSPTGHQYITDFDMEYLPVTTYKLGDLVLTKTIAMPRLGPTVLIRYDLINSKKPVLLKLFPFIAYRKIHELTLENTDIRPRTYFEENGFKIDPYSKLPPLYIQTSKHSVFYPSPSWWKNFEYVEEKNRGYDFKEDLFTPGVFEAKLKKGEHIIIRASTAKQSSPISSEWSHERERINKVYSTFVKDQEPLATLKVHAEHYLSKKQNGIIAGFHWFGEWGRDTMLSLPGITLCRNDRNTALAILKKYVSYIQNGLLPNVISSGEDHAYNSIDTSLLFYRAVQKYIEYTGDKKQVNDHLLKPMLDIVTCLIRNETGISKIEQNGLLYAGTPKTQLTWMDAFADGGPVTPRHGAAVEINALWYNALSFLLNDFSNELSPTHKQLIREAQLKFEGHFEKLFWNQDMRCLIDVYRNEHDVEAHIRPNQLFAIGLPFTCIGKEKAADIITTIKRHLVTPYGLRTLSPQNPLYKADYSGDQNKRDAAYHQGMVWPWLIGIFYDACLKTSGKKQELDSYFLSTFQELWSSHLHERGLFHISEIFTPNPAFQAKGCIAQAWSMAEIIRVLDCIKNR
ncbi:MAG: glycogen debranching enzyme N-terminal domain-containing protein [Spirochaetales bacterium]|nr:glycogen debranching enzyme N-terminal domain-containing protein [Spirochaetales bacterium]